MSKMEYIKPQFMPIALAEGSGSGSCAYTINYCEGVCQIDLGGGWTVFTKDCTYTGQDAEEAGLICFTEAGPGDNVYGS